MKKAILSLLFITSAAYSLAAGVGSWKIYSAYRDISEVDSVSSKCIFVLSSGNLYSVNTQEGSVNTYDRLTGLTSTGIATMAWNATAKCQILAYTNSNIDLLSLDGSVVNVPDLYQKTTNYSKAINDIYVNGKFAYLSTAFGIVKLDVAAAEISDSYNLGKDIRHVMIKGDRIYALVSDGTMLSAGVSDNLVNPAVWTTDNSGISIGEETVPASIRETIANLYPTGPKYPRMGCLHFLNKKLYLAEQNKWDDNVDDTPQVYDTENDSWTVCDNKSSILSNTDGIFYWDFMCIAPDPNNDNHFFAGSHGGIFEFSGDTPLNYFSNDNTPMTSAISGNRNYVLPSALTYAKDGTLWTVLSQAIDNQSLLSYKDGIWTSHHSDKWTYNNASMGYVMDMMQDSRGILWWVNNHWQRPALCGYDPSADIAYCYDTFVNEDGTTVSVGYVRSVAEDADGNLWIGTDVGPLMLESDDVTSGGTVTWNQVKVPRNDGTNYADYLLAGLDITDIAVDGANRKWFCTDGNGVYLVDKDNITQLENFTSSTSMLLSDNVLGMAIDNTTGEVYFGTTSGICSYHSDATAPVSEMSDDDIYAYPNPVYPDYSGPITVCGLSFDADVKITNTSGRLVAQGRSNGGSFTWYGTDTDGNKVASGVYIINIATSEGKKGAVTKVTIIR